MQASGSLVAKTLGAAKLGQYRWGSRWGKRTNTHTTHFLEQSRLAVQQNYTRDIYSASRIQLALH